MKWDERLFPESPPYSGCGITWVYHHLPLQSTQEHDAPNKGCWVMLLWARRNKSRFYWQMLPKAIAAEEKRAQAEKVQVKDEPKTVEERLDIFKDFVAKCEAEN